MIGLATCKELPEQTGGEHLLLEELNKFTPCKNVIWDDPRETWRECSQIIVRCTWDYFNRLLEFLSWIERVEQAGICLHNSADILRWNCDKKYMRDLAERGVLIPETNWIPRGTLTPDLLASLVRVPSVIKPTVSGGAFNTYRVSLETVGDVAVQLAEVAIEKELMLQAFIPEIESPGEYSLIYFRNEFSHAILKTPAVGDFRVQPRYGGQMAAIEVSQSVIAQGRDILEQIPFAEAPLYARVDGVLRKDQFILMELELIEPYLFLEYQENAAAILAAAFKQT